MSVLRRIRRQDRCAHGLTLTVQTGAIERVVCELCGHVSVRFLGDLTGDLDRDRFARTAEREGKHARADELAEQPAVDEVFSDTPSDLLTRDPDPVPWWVEPRPEDERAPTSSRFS